MEGVCRKFKMIFKNNLKIRVRHFRGAIPIVFYIKAGGNLTLSPSTTVNAGFVKIFRTEIGKRVDQ